MHIIKAFLVVLVVLLQYGCNDSETSTGQLSRPNVLIILADDLGYGDISVYEQSPYTTTNIDNIGAEGVISTAFYVTTPYCAPSRASILTGMFPLRHGLIKNPTPDAHAGVDTIGLNPEAKTIAEILGQSGYKTKAIGKWHLGHKPQFFPNRQGFDEYYGILYSNDMRPVQIMSNEDTLHYPVDQRTITRDYTERSIEFIKRNKDTNFFLYLSHAMPHKPLAVSDSFYTPGGKNNLYEDVINELDWSTGEIMKTLKNLNILDNTVVIFMSDNGPWYGGSTGGLKGMKATNWEGGIRVPFLIRYPKVLPKNAKVSIPLWAPDILPTICALTQTKAPDLMVDGQDITSVLQGADTLHGPVFSMHNDKIISVREGDFKLILENPTGFIPESADDWKDPRGPDGSTIIAQKEQYSPADYPGILPEHSTEGVQLFNVSRDPEEEINEAPNMILKVEHLKALTKAFKAGFNSADPDLVEQDK
ncbi:DUF229 domain-containing protein [Robertkochia marina]|uniref:DUF229 domain-containing protein n=1 Tax=Robertkochia marina TaxID=1227945 RepID=A0A4S3LYW1_9FLAO|nr:sulfatase-like hydrolase/transferase [Robertkochia marina]THD66818.1 DUF229 domain-containing protein [Robertkochia marina]TRZ40885.1 DUF229 domain-containing protein [Robertkochia marina]